MALQSMTGFARVTGRNDEANWVWEVRSVNGKGLDFRLRTPPGHDNLQPQIRKLVSKYFSRGNLQINLTIDRPGSQPLPVVNEAALANVLEAIAELQKTIECSPPAAEKILAIKGVMEAGQLEDNEDQRAALEKALMIDFDKLLKELEKARSAEGAAVVGFLSDQVNQIDMQTKAINGDPSRSLEQIKQKLSQQVARLLENTTGLDVDRLHQEAAILAAKADLQEELDRLSAHIDSARQLLSANEPVGRKLDFLCQEFNRECNTICSKSNATTVTAIGLDMKVVIDQLREQVQNLE